VKNHLEKSRDDGNRSTLHQSIQGRE